MARLADAVRTPPLVAQRSARRARAGEAPTDAGLLDSGVDRTRVGVLFGAGTGDLLRNEYLFTYLGAGIDRAKPTEIFHHFSNIPVDIVARRST